MSARSRSRRLARLLPVLLVVAALVVLVVAVQWPGLSGSQVNDTFSQIGSGLSSGDSAAQSAALPHADRLVASSNQPNSPPAVGGSGSYYQANSGRPVGGNNPPASAPQAQAMPTSVSAPSVNGLIGNDASLAAATSVPAGAGQKAGSVSGAQPAATATAAGPNEPQYKPDPRLIGVNPFVPTTDDHLSTFALDVDTGSYVAARNYLNAGSLPPADTVRVEEFVNYLLHEPKCTTL